MARGSINAPKHTGFGDCGCDECWPPEPEFPLADHGERAGLLRSLWIVLRGARFYVARVVPVADSPQAHPEICHTSSAANPDTQTTHNPLTEETETR